MISPIGSSTAPLPDSAQVHNVTAPKPSAKTPQDHVQLSPQALSSGDVDHDGDSH